MHSPFYTYHLAQGGCSKVAGSELLLSDERVDNGEATVLRVAGDLKWERKTQQEKRSLSLPVKEREPDLQVMRTETRSQGNPFR